MVLEEVIFVVLNILFIGLIIFFASRASSGALALEEFYAKEIALLIDASSPEQIMKIDITEAKKVSEENNINLEQIIKIREGFVFVKLSQSGNYKFPFFNDVLVSDLKYETDESGNIYVVLLIGES